MRGTRGFAAAVACAAALLASRVEAASVSVEAPVRVEEGWTRAAGHYDCSARAPTFRAVARCGSETRELFSIVHLAPAEGVLWLDLPDTPERLLPPDVRCAEPDLRLEMVVDAEFVASTAIPLPADSTSVPRAALEPAAAAPTPAPGRVRLSGQKYASPVGPRTEAGLAVALDSHLSLQLNYARIAQVPLMPYANDNGILARFRFGF